MTKQKTNQPDQPAKIIKPAQNAEIKEREETADLNTPAFTHIAHQAASQPAALTNSQAAVLQRTLGNQGVGRLLIQTKLTVGPAGDKYEQEADATAKAVVKNINTSGVQRQPEEEDPALQAKPISSLQRQPEEEDPTLQAKGNGLRGGGELDTDMETAVTNARSGGQALSDQVRQPMESAFNADFSQIKIHTHSQADSLNRSLNARAFTTGNDIFFRQGEYNPSSSSGQELLAHELTHTVQQGAASIQRKMLSTLPALTTGSRRLQRGSGDNSISNTNTQTTETRQEDDIISEKKSVLNEKKILKPGEGVIAAVSKSGSGTGGHSWVAYEYLASTGHEKNAVMHLTAEGGLGDSGSGGSGGSQNTSGSGGLGDLSGSNVRKIGGSGSVKSGVVSNENDSGSVMNIGSNNSNVGSVEQNTFGSITIKIDDNASSGYLGSMKGKTNRTWDIDESRAQSALQKAREMEGFANQGKYIYSLTGRTISFTKTGMNCARFAEKVLKAAGIKVNAGWIIKTPSELSTGKKAGFRKSSKKSKSKDDTGSTS